MLWGQKWGRGVSRRLAEARRVGVGLYVREWRHDEDQPLLEAVIDWCRDVMAGARRPYGLDRFDIAIAFRAADGARSGSRKFAAMQPDELYDQRSALAAWLAALLPQPGAVHVAVAVYAWGDAVHAALPERV